MARREEEKEAKAEVKSEEEDPLSLFIRRWIKGMRRNRGGRKNDYVATRRPRFSGGTLKIKICGDVLGFM